MNNVDKKTLDSLKKICSALKLGAPQDVTILDSSQNIVYKVKTEDKTYTIKEYSKDAIRDEEDLIDRKRQVSVSEQMGKNGVPVILPLKFNKKNFIHYKGKYYLIYDFKEYKTITSSELTVKNIKKLANTLAIIHKLNIKCDLPCQYEKISINFSKYIKKFEQQKSSEEIVTLLKENANKLEELIKICNENIKLVKNHLCISHNDYKLGNILWEKDYMYLIDFDACCMSNPTVSLAESAFALSRQNGEINEKFYTEYILSYVKKYGNLDTDYKIALNVAMNGKLQWLEYLLKNATKKDEESLKGSICMLKELIMFCDNKDKLYSIYQSIEKKLISKVS